MLAAVTVISSASAGIIEINSPVTIETGDSSLQNPSDHLLISTTATGDLLARNQGLVEGAIMHVASSSSSIGSLTIEDTGSSVTSTEFLVVGNRGNGTMTVRDGGLVDVDPAGQGVTVDAGRGFLGFSAEGVGTVDIDGPGSVWQMLSHLYVGWQGDGTMTITNGGTVTSLRGRIARFDDSVGIVNVIGSGSAWRLDPVIGNLGIGHGAVAVAVDVDVRHVVIADRGRREAHRDVLEASGRDRPCLPARGGNSPALK